MSEETLNERPKPRPQRARHVINDPAFERQPPNSPEAEVGILGCILLDPPRCLPECIEKLKEGAETFYDLRHQTIYGAMVECFNHGKPIDVITLQQALKDKQLLDQVGGLAYLSQLPDTTPSAANLESYLEIVLEKRTLRRMIHVCTDVIGRVQDSEGDVATLMDECERDILRISESRVQATSTTAKELVGQVITQVEQEWNNPGQVTGLSTGFQELDRMTGGLQPANMIVLAARPSMGKSSLAMNIADHVAVDLGKPVGVFSLEMTSKALMRRNIAARARVNMRNVREGLTEADFARFTRASGQLAKAPLHIDDSRGLSILQLRAKARRMHQQHGIELFVIDYLQLLNAIGGRKHEGRQQEVADISAGIKNLSGELKVAVIVLAQLNRELEKEKNRKPRMADLRESGSIEQDGDTIGFLYKPGTEDEEQASGDTPAVNLLIAKQREGPTGDIHLVFYKQYTRFESRAKIQTEDLPQEPRSHSSYLD